jgi:hypothetical protein
MEKRSKDSGMDQKRGHGRAGCILAAAVLWALVAYSLSPLSKPPLARLASSVARLCDPRP